MYGQETPPNFNVDNIRDIPVALFCGTQDLLSSHEDYKWLKDTLEKNRSLAAFHEYPLGHLGLLMPNDEQNFKDILKVLKDYNP